MLTLLNRVLILHCERCVTYRTRVLLTIFHADHSCTAGWAFPLVLTHSENRTGKWQEDSQYDHWNAQEDAPA